MEIDPKKIGKSVKDCPQCRKIRAIVIWAILMLLLYNVYYA